MSCANGSSESGPVPEGREEELLMPRRIRPTVSLGTCIKCRLVPSTILRSSISYCTPCFLSSVYSRFAKILHAPLYASPNVSDQPGTSVKMGGKASKIAGGQTTGRPGLQSGNVMIGLSGGASSMTMLDMLMSKEYIGQDSPVPVTGDARNGSGEGGGGSVETGAARKRREGQRKWVWTNGWIVHVDFSGIIPGLAHLPAQLHSQLESYGNSNVRFLVIKVEDAFDEDFVGRIRRLDGKEESEKSMNEETSIPSTSTSPLSQLQSLLSSLPPSSHPHILSLLLSSLLTICASNLPNITHLLLGETSTRQAQNIVSGTATGRGWSLPLDLAAVRGLRRSSMGSEGEEVLKKQEIIRIKPMRDAMYKEVAYYCHVKKIETVNWRRWEAVAQSRTGSSTGSEPRGKGPTKSLEQLTEDFITSLSVTHPSTVSTISRTGSKLVFDSGRSDEDRSAGGAKREALCPLCGMPAEPSSLEWKARTALTTLTGKGVESDLIADTVLQEKTSVGAISGGIPDLAEKLCYACLTAMTPVPNGKVETTNGKVGLPYWVEERTSGRVGTSMSREEMKDSVKEFMLDDEEES